MLVEQMAGTLVTIAGFVPVGFAKSGAGEYCFTMFVVIAVAGMDAVAVLEAVGRRRGCLRQGKLDLEKAAQVLLQDYRDGALGRISLETPDSRAAMLAQPAALPPVAEADDE